MAAEIWILGLHGSPGKESPGLPCYPPALLKLAGKEKLVLLCTVAMPGKAFLVPAKAVVVHWRLPSSVMSSTDEQSESLFWGRSYPCIGTSFMKNTDACVPALEVVM